MQLVIDSSAREADHVITFRLQHDPEHPNDIDLIATDSLYPDDPVRLLSIMNSTNETRGYYMIYPLSHEDQSRLEEAGFRFSAEGALKNYRKE